MYCTRWWYVVSYAVLVQGAMDADSRVTPPLYISSETGDAIFERFSEIAPLRGAFLRQKPQVSARYTVWRYTRKSGFPV